MLEKIFSLHNKNVFITGAAGLLGRRHAEAICIAGGRPILVDTRDDALRELALYIKNKFLIDAVHLKVDITKESDVEHAQKTLSIKGIPVHVLINNAARNPQVGADQNFQKSYRLEKFPISELLQDFNVGVVGALNCTKVFGTAMAKAGSGVILNISSDLGVIAPDQRLYAVQGKAEEEQEVKPVSYSIVKHGIIGLTKYTATYWATKGVRCNALSPGGVYNNQNSSFLNKVQNLIPMQRMANVEEYEGAIIFMCSEASSYMNGANLVIDGGRSVW